MAKATAELYDEDFYAWTQQQAEALRTHFKGDNRIDVEHLAQEIEDLGKSELHAVESYVEQIVAHLLKLDYSGFESSSRGHWRGEVEAFSLEHGAEDDAVDPARGTPTTASSVRARRVLGRGCAPPARARLPASLAQSVPP